MIPEGFQCPENMRPHLAHVFAGEYDIPISFPEKPPVVLDLGANCGAFTLWALKRWPGCTVHAYEPQREAFEMLARNVSVVAAPPGGRTVNLHRQAVGDPSQHTLFHGLNNQGEASLNRGGCRDYKNTEDVEVIGPGALPEAHIVKMDIEGSEAVVVAGLKFAPIAIMLEYHNETWRRAIDAMLHSYTLAGSAVYDPGRGISKYLRTDCLGVR